MPKDYHIRFGVNSYNYPAYKERPPVALHINEYVQYDGKLVIYLVAEFEDNYWMNVGQSGYVLTGDRERAIAFAERKIKRLTESGLDKWWYGMVDTQIIKDLAAQEDWIAKAQDRLAETRREFEELRARRHNG